MQMGDSTEGPVGSAEEDKGLERYITRLVSNKFVFDVTKKEWVTRAKILTSSKSTSSEAGIRKKMGTLSLKVVSAILPVLLIQEQVVHQFWNISH